LTRTKKKFKFPAILRIAIAFLIIMGILLVERQGLGADSQNTSYKEVLPKSQTTSVKQVSDQKTCLYIWQSSAATSAYLNEQFQVILSDMRIPANVVDLDKQAVSDLSTYQTVIIALANMDSLQADLPALESYVRAGGQVLFASPMELTASLQPFLNLLGISSLGPQMAMADSFHPMDGFLIGGDGQTYSISGGYESSMDVELTSDCQALAETDDSLPLIWQRTYGRGRVVVCNFAYCEKAYRGIFAAAYSRLDSVCIYPVINASAFYLDDFPSPVPRGDSSYISRDYQMDVARFYSNVWWPDLVRIARKYGIRYTGAIIETYEDQTSGDLPENQETSNYYYYGNQLLNLGGELGYHGYNHQPLCGPGFVYTAGDDYKTWESSAEMVKALKELYRFASGIYPKAHLLVYVPPSNILSDEGRKLLGEDRLKGLRSIASCYLPSGNSYAQEFTVASDGIVEAPRIISGGIMDDYTRMTAMSELNFHYVNSHFMHPDDLMDKDRGAELGWKTLKKRITNYIKWLEKSAPGLRQVTGSGMAADVQRFATVTPEVEINGNEVKVQIRNFHDDASFLFRCNDGQKPASLSGGKITKVGDDAYLVEADSDSLVIEME
jgi:hypothetical protein